MSTKIASLFAEIGADTTGFEAGAKKTKSGMTDLGKLFNSVLPPSITQFLTLGGAIGGMSAALAYSVKQAAEAERVDAQLAAALESTHGAAGMSAKALEDMAISLSHVSMMDDEAIKKGEALLLTFTKVGKDVFPGAMQAALDMSTALGTDLQSSVIQLGKALNDPIRGVTALQRVGVSFTESQRDQIKTLVETGHALEAQKLILDELSTEFGGQAAAAADTYAGSVAQMQNELNNLAEEVGKNAAPAMSDFNKQVTEAARGWQEFLRFFRSQSEIREIQIKLHAAAGATKDLTYYAEQATGIWALQQRVLNGTASEMENYEDAGVRAAERVSAANEDTVASVGEIDEAYKALEAANAESLDMMINLTGINKDFAASQDDITKQQANIKAEIDTLIAQGWSPLSEKVQDLQKDYDDLGLKYAENATEHQNRLTTILTDMTLEKIAMQDGVAGFSAAEAEKALAVAQTTGVVDAEAIKQQVAFDQVSTAVANGTIKVAEMKSLLELMVDREWTIDVALNMLQRGYAGYGNGLSYATGDLQYQNQHAAGGSFRIPMAYGNEGFRLGNGDTASGGELIKISPNGSSDDAQVQFAALVMSRMPTARGIAKELARELDMRGMARR